MAKYNPETAAALGVDGYDGDVADLKPANDTRFEADSERVAQALEAKLATATDTRVKQDLQILVTAAREQKTTSELARRLMLPYYDVPNLLFSSFQRLLDPRVDKARYPAALERLRKYTGREAGYEPITKLAQGCVQIDRLQGFHLRG